MIPYTYFWPQVWLFPKNKLLEQRWLVSCPQGRSQIRWSDAITSCNIWGREDIVSLSQSLSLESVPSPALWTHVWVPSREKLQMTLLLDSSNSGSKETERKELLLLWCSRLTCGFAEVPVLAVWAGGSPKGIGLVVCTCENPMGIPINTEQGCIQGAGQGRYYSEVWVIILAWSNLFPVTGETWRQTFRLYYKYIWVETNSVCQMPQKYWIYTLFYF